MLHGLLRSCLFQNYTSPQSWSGISSNKFLFFPQANVQQGQKNKKEAMFTPSTGLLCICYLPSIPGTQLLSQTRMGPWLWWPQSHPRSSLVIPKLLVGYRLRRRSVSRDTLLRSTSFLLRNPLSCRASSSSAGHGAPSSSSCGNSSFQSCPP